MRKLAWFTGGFAGICLLCCYGAPGLYRPLLAAAFALTLLALALRPNLRAYARPFAVLRRALALCLGGAAAAGWFWGYDLLFRSPAGALAGETLAVTGTVESWPEETSIGGCSLTVALDGGLTAPDVLVYAPESWAELRPGDRVSFTVRMASADTIRGEETTYYTAKGIFLLGYANGPPEAVTHPDRVPPRYWPAWCARALRDSLTAAFPADAAPLAVALVTGNRSGLDKGLTAALSRAGASHAVVVSGMHVASLMALFLLVVRDRRRFAVVMLPLLLFYALMAGGTPSALRAVVMQGVILLAPFAKREYDLPTSLAFALLILLLPDPYAAGSISLQLSFTSTAGIIAVTPVLSSRWDRSLKELRRRHAGHRGWRVLTGAGFSLSNTFAVSLGAMAFTQPVLALYFGQGSLIFPVTNLLILWAVQALLLCALLVGTLGLLLPGPARMLGWLSGWLARYVTGVVSALGRMRFAAVDLTEPCWALFMGGVWLILLIYFLPWKTRPRPAVPAVCLAALFAGALGFARLPVDDSLLTVTALNVGQGSATAFLSGGRTCLVDCGGNLSDSAGDVAADYFASLGVRRLDALVLTHFDADHVNGVSRLFDRMEVGTVFLPDAGEGSPRRDEVLSLAEAEGAEVVSIGGKSPVTAALGDAVLTLYPPLGGGTSNEEGLFLLCSQGDFDVLVTGDADSFVEKMLIKYYAIPDLELLVVGHHGSKSSTSPELLDAALPELAVISAGYNTYGHPSPETLKRLAERGVRAFRTDQLGTVSVHVRKDGGSGYTYQIAARQE